MGVELQVPVIGVAKSELRDSEKNGISFDTTAAAVEALSRPDSKVFDRELIRAKSPGQVKELGRKLGYAMRTSDQGAVEADPIYVSPGHLVTLNDAAR